jgi:hypothetical protein
VPKFAPGQSGNPKGGPKAPRRYTVAMRRMVADRTPAIIEKVLDEAGGPRDTLKRREARQLVFRFLLPKPRMLIDPVDFVAPKDHAQSRALVLELARQAAAGNLDLDALDALVSALKAADELDRVDLAQRLEALTNRIDGAGQRANPGQGKGNGEDHPPIVDEFEA